MISQQELKQLFIYEPETGMLRRIGGRKSYPWRGIGKDCRYLAHTLANGKTIYLHQAVWLYHHGSIPPMLDHKDRDPSNCRIDNLRICTNAQNQYNSLKKSNNRSGYKGVAYCQRSARPWRARIVVNKAAIDLGYFNTPEEAAVAYVAGAQRYAREFALS